MASPKKGEAKIPRRASMVAIGELRRLGINPIDEIWEALQFNKKMTLKGGNYDSTGKTDQSAFAALWLKAAVDIAKFRYPQLSAVAIKDLSDENKPDAIPMTSQQAIEIMRKDPFFPKSEIPDQNIVDQIGNVLTTPFLPEGVKDEKKP